ncbi:MAG: hypothetical protein HGB17_15070, partial [Syntrophobacteraceae bacterium]|nr:hypothetical protein [Syntrophobacteraceae bacterium]
MTPDGRHAVSASRDKTLKVWDIMTAECLNTFKGHTGKINCLALTPNDEMIVSGSEDKTIKVWDLGLVRSGERGKELRTLSGHARAILTLAISSDGGVMVSG